MRKLLAKIRKILKDRRTRQLLTRTVSVTAAVVVFVTTYALVLPAITMETEADCGIEAHQHDSSCYEEQLICGEAERPGHHHVEECYKIIRNLACAQDAHQHDSECYDNEGNLICQLPEHVHEDSCYEEIQELICEIPETEGHQHTDSCYEWVLICEKEPHTHSSACYSHSDSAASAWSTESAAVAATENAAAGITVRTFMEHDNAELVENTAAEATDAFDTIDTIEASNHEDFSDIGITENTTAGASTASEASVNKEIPANKEILANEETPANDGVSINKEAMVSATASVAATEDASSVASTAVNDSSASAASTAAGVPSGDAYVPVLDPLDFNQILTDDTGIYYFHAEDQNSAPVNSGDIRDWMPLDDKTILDPADIIRVYLAYSIPAGSLNTTNPVARYRLPLNLHLSDSQVESINSTVNGIANQYVSMDTLEITDPEKYGQSLGVEAIEGTRKPSDDIEEYFVKLTEKDSQEYISAIVKVEDVYDTAENDAANASAEAIDPDSAVAAFDEYNSDSTDAASEAAFDADNADNKVVSNNRDGTYLGTDLVFTFTPYSIQKNQHTYDSYGKPTSAGQKIQGWLTFDLRTDQIDFETINIETKVTEEDANTDSDAESGDNDSPDTESETFDNGESVKTGGDQETDGTNAGQTDAVNNDVFNNEANKDDQSQKENTEEYTEKNTDSEHSKDDQTETDFTEKTDEKNDDVSDSAIENAEENGEKTDSTLADDKANTTTSETEKQTIITTTTTKEATIVFVPEIRDSLSGLDLHEISQSLLVQEIAAELRTGSEDKSEGADTDKGVVSDKGTDSDKELGLDGSEKDDKAEKSALLYPALTFRDSITVSMGTLSTDTENGQSTALPEQTELTVYVEADEETFPEGTTMKLSAVEDMDAVASAVEEAVTTDDAVSNTTRGFHAVDISFWNTEGIEIEPLKPIRVSMKSESIKKAVEDVSTAPVVVHIADPVSDQGATDSSDEDKTYESEGEDKASNPETEEDSGTEKQTNDNSDNESPIAAIVETEKQTSTEDSESNDTDTLTFETGTFSVYAVVYTVDFHYEVNGKIYDFSIPGGGFVSLSKLVEVLGISGLTEGDSFENDDTENNVLSAAEKAEAEDEDENAVHDVDVLEESSIEDDTDKDSEIYQEAISLNSIPTSEAARRFVADVENISFSSPHLVDINRVNTDTTVGEIKQSRGLSVQYSTELTEEQIKKIDSQVVEAGDWALISLCPFDTEESLTITMMNGDEFFIRVTDAQEISDSSASSIDVNKSYVICCVENNRYYILKTDGSVDNTHVPANFDNLNSTYCWSFNFVFEEKDREGTLTYNYYLIRPIDDKSRTIALYDVTSAQNPLVQQSNNNVAVVPAEGGFKLVGYNNIRLAFENGEFRGKIAPEVDEGNPDSFNGTTIKIYEMGTLPNYDYTVRSFDEEMGTVTVSDGTLRTETHAGAADTHYYDATSNPDKKNNGTITATPASHTNTDLRPGQPGYGVNKWEFDYWELNGKKLDPADYPQTINRNSIEFPYNGSKLIAHFRQKSNYIVPDREKQGSRIESMEQWLKDLKKRNIPLNADGTNKTAEVYDYENRIYRIDFTAQSNLTTFDGEIDLGFVLDVSGSMQFPSLLYPTNDVSGAKQISQINNNNNASNWGLKTNKTYYIIADPSGTATVCYLYYWDNQWWLCDASKNRFAGQNDSGNNGRFNPGTGWSVYGSQNYGDSYYSTSASYTIQEAGDRVTQADFQNSETAALLNKLGLGINDPKSRAFYLEKSLNSTIKELKSILGILSLASNNSNNPDVKIAWNTFKNNLPSGNNRNHYDFVSASTGIELDYDINTYGGGTSTDIALLDAAGVKRSDVKNGNDGTGQNTDDAVHTETSSVYRGWYRTERQYNENYNKNTAYSNYSNPANGFQWNSSSKKYAVLITDGAPQRSGDFIYRGFVDDAAEQLKNKGVNLITVGLGVDNVTSGKILLYDIADSINNQKMFYSAKTGNELEDVLLQIIQSIMDDAAIQGKITDVISEAFYPVDAAGKPLPSGTTIDLEGNVTTNLSKPYGKITYGPVNVGTNQSPVMENRYKVEWSDQNLTWDGWHGTVFVKAKEDFLGGNSLATNENDAVIVAEKYKVGNKPAVNLKQTRTEAVYENGELVVGEYNPRKELETPRVNVNELSFLHDETEWTVYLGTEVDPKDQLKRLFDNILVEEVIKKDKGRDTNGDGLPDTVQYTATDTDNNWYPISQNSIKDDRESQAGDAASRNSFYLKDLIKVLAQGKNYDWWDYINNEPNWNTFFTKALTETQKTDSNGNLLFDDEHNPVMEVTGFMIPYDAYGIGDEDNSYIQITLTKEIKAGEETDIINKSPHDTTVVSDVDSVAEKYLPVEKYILSVRYSPDYDVLPKGQGGSSNVDFHVGPFGTMYQGHAAGTETSRNTHIINVYSKGLSITKTDEVFSNQLTGAEFILYRTARETDTVERVNLPNIAGEYVAVAELDMSENATVEIESLAGLKDGEKYYLIETKAPDGYTMLTSLIEVRVELTDDKTLKVMEEYEDDSPTDVEATVDGIYNWTQKAVLKLVGSGFKRTDKEGEGNYTNVALTPDIISDKAYYMIANNPGTELPSTGGPGPTLFFFFGTILILIAGAGMIVMKRSRRGEM